MVRPGARCPSCRHAVVDTARRDRNASPAARAFIEFVRRELVG